VRRFAEAARLLAGQTALLLGWRPPEFWNSTPAELAAIFAALDSAGPPRASMTQFTTLMERFPDG